MAKQNRSEQFDTIVERMLGRPGRLLAPGGVREPFDKRLAPVMALVRELRDLPRRGFKARLRADLERRASMASAGVKPVREGFRTITPYLIVNEAPELVDFVTQAFGAQELYRGTGSAGGLHCEVKIGDSMLMIGGGQKGQKWRGTPSPTALHLSVADVDSVYKRALEAGATAMQPPADQEYGSRHGWVADPSGNQWYISTLLGPRENRPAHLIPVSAQTVTVYLHPVAGNVMIEFLKNAFGAEEVYKAQSPEGRVHHARVRMGDSVLELGDAHGPYQPMPTTLFLYVEHADAVYLRAVKAGATSLYPPMDQPYGDRNGGVKDPFGNTWYISTHIRDMAG